MSIASQEQHGVEVIPGTEILIYGDSEHAGNAEKVRLVPEPSDDPSDPLVREQLIGKMILL